MKEDFEKIISAYDFGKMKIHFAPNIPQAKIDNAFNAYIEKTYQTAKEEFTQKLIFLYDDTMFGKADSGISLTDNALFSSRHIPNFKEIQIYTEIKDIRKIIKIKKNIYLNDQIPGFEILKLSCDSNYVEALCLMMTDIISLIRNDTVKFEEFEENSLEYGITEDEIKEKALKAGKIAGKASWWTAKMAGRLAVGLAAESINMLASKGAEAQGRKVELFTFHKDILSKGVFASISDSLTNSSQISSEKYNNYQDKFQNSSLYDVEKRANNTTDATERRAAENIIETMYTTYPDDELENIIKSPLHGNVDKKIAGEILKNRKQK